MGGFQSFAGTPFPAPLIAIGLIGLGIWVWAIVTVVRSPKFLRKFLWILLTLLTFSFSWSEAGGRTLGVGLPVGALYVLGFARWGKSPTDAERAARALLSQVPAATRQSVRTLHIAYGCLAAAFAATTAWTAFGPVSPMMIQASGADAVFGHAFRLSMAVFGAVFLSLLVFLAVRPYPLAKLLCAFCALAWIGHGLISLLVMPMAFGPGFPTALHAGIVGGAGLVAAACGIVHHRLDRRLTGSYLRAA